MTSKTRRDPNRVIRSPRGPELTCKSWLTEAPYRMIQNNLDPEVAERPEELVVYGGIGRAARNWECYDKILETLKLWKTTKAYAYSRENRLACLRHIKMHRAC